MVGVILDKGLGHTLVATGGLPLGLSLGTLLGMREGFLIGILGTYLNSLDE